MHNYALDRAYKDELRFGGNKEKSLIRDDYTCQDCGSKNNLVTHHKDKSGQKDNPNNEINNLITLCISCHMKRHKGDNRSGKYSVCEYCGKEIYIKKSDREGRHKYCNKECCDKDKIGKLKTSIIKHCLVCGKEFKAVRANVLLGKAKYCSPECSRIGQIKSILMFCQTCGAGFEIKPGRVRAGKGKYCSNLCFQLRNL